VSSLVLCAQLASAQHYRIQTYTEEHGLPSSFVTALAQDSDGLMWFSTRAGIASFDGNEWERHDQPDSHSTPQWNFLHIDASARVWAVGGNKLSYLDGGNWRSLQRIAGASDASIAAMADRPGEGQHAFLLGTSRGELELWDGESWTRIERMPSTEPRLFGLAASGERTWVASGSGLLALDPGAHALRAIATPPGSGAIKGMFHDAQRDVLWLVSESWLGVVERASAPQHEPARGIDDARIQFEQNMDGRWIAEGDGRGGLYFADFFALYHYHADSGLERLGLPAGFTSEGGTSLVLDSEGNLWCGGPRGVDKLVSRRFLNFDKDSGLLEDEVTAILQRADGSFVLGHNGGLSYIPADWSMHGALEISLQPLPGEPRLARVMDLAEDRDGTLWLAVEFVGLMRLRAGAAEPELVEPAPVGTHGNIVALSAVELDAQGRLWIGTQEGVYLRAGGLTRQLELTSSKPGAPAIRRVILGRDGRMYLPTFSQGLIIVDEEGDRRLDAPDPLLSSTYTVLEDSEGNVWVGGSAGLMLARDGGLVPWPGVQRPVYSLVLDARGRMWAGTDAGVMCIDGEEVVHYPPTRGVAGAEANRAAALLDDQGRVWLGTDRGLSIVRPEFDHDSGVPPRIELLSAAWNGASISLDAPSTTPRGSGELHLRFRAISFVDEERVLFRTRLEGYEDEWSEARPNPQREVRYTNLPHGEYRFALQAIDVTGQASSTVRSASLRVPRPLSQHPGLWTLALLVMVGLIVSLSVFVNQRRNAYALTLEVRRRTQEVRELERGQVQAQGLRSLGVLAGGIAHNFNNVLTAIVGNLELLVENHELDADGQEAVGNVLQSCMRARSLTQQLLTFSRGGEPVRELAPLADFLHDCTEFALSGSSTSIEFEIADDLWRVEMDVGQMSHALHNLLLNARQACSGHGHIVVRAHNAVVAEERFVALEVEDNGPGAAADQAERMFEPYFTTKQEGTGLGLATTRSIVSQHGGRVEYERAASGGALFRVLLPADSAHAVVETREPAPAPQDSLPSRVLVMDDDELVRHALGRVLERLGHTPLLTCDGEEALERFQLERVQGRPIDAFILDLTVPGGMGGLETMSELAALDPDVRVIVSSGYAENGVLSKPQEHGFCARLLKPFQLEDLRQALHSAIGSASS